EWNESEAQITGLKRSDAVGIPIWEAQLRVAPEEKRDPRRLEQMRDSTLEVIRTGQAPWLNKLTEDEIQRPDGTRRIIQSSVFLTKTSKGVMIGSVSRDITEQKQAKEKLQRAKNLSDTLNRINIEINLTIDLDEILQHVVDRCVEAVGAETGVILLKESHQWAVKYLNRRLREQRPEFLNLQFEENQLNAAMRAINTGKPIAVDDSYNDEASNQEMVRKYSIRSYLVTPLISRGTVAGVLMIIYNSAPTTFDNDTVDFASKVATAVSLALENTRLFEEQKQVEEELRKARDELEARVQERTTDLIKANRALEIEVSERRQIENALRKSEERFKQVAQSSGAWIWEVDTEGLYTYSNSTVEKILGYSPEEIVGKSHFYDFFVPELRESLKKAALDMFGKKESFKAFLNSNVDKKGNIVFLETSGLPILDEQGNLLGYRGADVDVTEQKLDEEELREREHSYRTLAENLPGIVYRVFLRENDRMQFFNDMVQSMTGYTAEELTTGDVCAIDPLILAVDRDRVTSVVKRAVVNNQPFQLEYRIMRKDGDIRQFYERGRPVYGADGKPIYVDGVIFDISERKKADERLLEQAELLDKARDVIVVRDVKNSIIYWNMGAERLYGWKAEEVLGKNFNQLFYSEMPAILAEAQQAVIGKGEWVGELTQVTKDGREVVVQARWTLVRDDDGKPKSILVINTDVTEKKNLEAQLLRAQRLEVVGALAGGVAHDINNVLTPIMLSLYILKGKLKDEDGENLIEILETSAKRGASLIKQIQTFARGAEGERKPIKITDVISEVQKMIKETFPRNIEVRTYLDSNLQTISGNATEIHQVIMNLCVNARDAMPNGGTLGISAENITMNEKDTH
ncbi:MAG TPA: PAS domain S-box protein, partial [Candidatus Hodarchaeales archaeon]|nr:PAS domain S-box protein [Candidatus Hodarchaeales archaeon]